MCGGYTNYLVKVLDKGSAELEVDLEKSHDGKMQVDAAKFETNQTVVLKYEVRVD